VKGVKLGFRGERVLTPVWFRGQAPILSPASESGRRNELMPGAYPRRVSHFPQKATSRAIDGDLDDTPQRRGLVGSAETSDARVGAKRARLRASDAPTGFRPV
jgi:hypothetical protein